MLFNSYEFIFAFLPAVFLGFFILNRYASRKAVLIWLFLSSLFFYTWWDPIYFFLIIGSILSNYLIADRIHFFRDKVDKGIAQIILVIGITANLLSIFYFKYMNFFIDSLNTVSGAKVEIEEILLPLGISFFTFQQIAYLVESYKGHLKPTKFFEYGFFVSFFPQLIAGPIVRHTEVLPQLYNKNSLRFTSEYFAMGLFFFSMGLFKKVVLADGIAVYVGPIFGAADSGLQIDAATAWIGAMAYSLQLYFDFSGYSDMAIGLALFFGIRLPLNFNSPYKASNIVDFWRRWHMTLSRFFRDYLYIPMGGNREGYARSNINLLATMLLTGLWHGAAWTFVVWGLFHGMMVVVCHLWQKLLPTTDKSLGYRFAAWMLTFLLVVLGWVLFRAETFGGASNVIMAMFGFGVTENIYSSLTYEPSLLRFISKSMAVIVGNAQFEAAIAIAGLLLVVWVLPNTYQLLCKSIALPGADIVDELNLCWEPKATWACLAGLCFTLSILTFTQISEFIYFRF